MVTLCQGCGTWERATQTDVCVSENTLELEFRRSRGETVTISADNVTGVLMSEPDPWQI